MRTRRLAAGLTAIALVTTGCGGSDEAASPPISSPTATEAPEPTVAPTETAEAIDVAAVPDEFTVEYVQAVMDELDRVEYELLIAARDRGEMGEQFVASMFDLWGSEYAANIARAYQENVGPEGVRADATPFESEVTSVDAGTAECVQFRVRRDERAVLTDEAAPPNDGELVIVIEPEEPTDANPTRWRFAYINTGEPTDGCTK